MGLEEVQICPKLAICTSPIPVLLKLPWLRHGHGTAPARDGTVRGCGTMTVPWSEPVRRCGWTDIKIKA